MDNILITNEYGTLKEVVVGISPTMYFPDSHEIEMEAGNPWWKKAMTKLIYPLLKGKKVPGFIAEKYQKELADLKSTLESYGVNVLHPDEIEPGADEPAGLGQMFARDPAMCVNNTMISGNLQIDMRKKELRGYKNILAQFKEDNKKVEILPTDSGAYLEGGDVLIDLPNVYVGIGKYASNSKGAEWLQEKLGPDIKVVPVKLADERILHLDCCMTLIGPKQGIIHRSSLQDPLPYPLNTYDFIEVDAKTRAELGTNILMVNPKTIIVQKRHTKLQPDLKEKGFSVIPIDFTWHTSLDGAFRCATCPIYREK